MRSFEQRTKRFYLFIVFGMAWGLLATILTDPNLPTAYFTFFIAIAPLFAAYVLHITSYSQSFLSRSFLQIKPNFLWISALLIPVLYGALLVSTYSLPLLSLIKQPLWLLVLVYCLFQEIGWRGFYQRELHEYPFWLSSLTVGAITACWHVPIALIIFQATDAQVIALVCFYMLIAAPLAFMIATSKSVVPAVFMHTSFLLLFVLTIYAFQTLIVFFALLLLLNGVIMLVNAVYPNIYKQTFRL